MERENAERGLGGYRMRIFLDTANIDEIHEPDRWDILSGVTTDPTLMMKSGGKSHEAVIRKIAEIVDGPISAECGASPLSVSCRRDVCAPRWSG